MVAFRSDFKNHLENESCHHSSHRPRTRSTTDVTGRDSLSQVKQPGFRQILTVQDPRAARLKEQFTLKPSDT